MQHLQSVMWRRACGTYGDGSVLMAWKCLPSVWYPSMASKGDMLVMELVRKLWAYLTQDRHVLHVEGLLATVQHTVG